MQGSAAAVTIAATSALDIFYAGVALLALAAVIVAIAIWRRRPAAAGDLPATWGQAADDRRWDDEAAEAQHQQLALVRAAAAAWGTAISSLLGVFALVAFVKGPTTFTDVKGSAASAAALLVLLAAVAAAVAVLLAALAAQGVPRDLAILDGWELRHQTAVRARTATVQLAWSRILGVLAALIVLAAVGLTWLTALHQSQAEKSQQLLLVTKDGVVHCGTLVKLPQGLALKQTDGTIIDATNAREIETTQACP